MQYFKLLLVIVQMTGDADEPTVVEMDDWDFDLVLIPKLLLQI